MPPGPPQIPLTILTIFRAQTCCKPWDSLKILLQFLQIVRPARLVQTCYKLGATFKMHKKLVTGL